MRQILAVVFGCCLLVPFVGTWTWLQVYKSHLRKEVREHLIAGLDRADLKLLKFPETEIAEISWHDDREFEYRGEMYDVVDREQCADSVYLWCWWDHAETFLNQQLDDLASNVANDDPQNRNAQQHLLDFLKTVCFHEECPAAFLQPAHSGTPIAYGPYFYFLHGLAPPAPPPDITETIIT